MPDLQVCLITGIIRALSSVIEGLQSIVRCRNPDLDPTNQKAKKKIQMVSETGLFWMVG